jgi:hypothetical protein
MLIQSVFLNLFITGIFLIGYAFPVHRLFPDSYYAAVCSEAFASACSILRIEQFRKLLRRTFWGARFNKRHFFDGTRRGFAQFDKNTRISESSHTLAFVTILLVSVYLGIVADPLLAVGVILVDLGFNFYPAMLQRYHRARLLAVRKQTVRATHHPPIGRLTKR